MTTNLMTELVTRREILLAATGFSISSLWLLARRSDTILNANEMVLPNVTTKSKEIGPLHRYSITYGAELKRRPSSSVKTQLDTADEAAGKRLQRRPSWSAKFEGHDGTLPEATKAGVRQIISSDAPKVTSLSPSRATRGWHPFADTGTPATCAMQLEMTDAMMKEALTYIPT